MNVATTNKRILWVDTLRFLGMLAIYVGHFGQVSGRAYSFVFIYHVPLFFFVSGAVESLVETNCDFIRYVWKKFQSIMLPYFFFSLITILILFLSQELPADSLIAMAKQTLLGVRNATVAGALWFLPCLFVMSVLFGLIRRVINKHWLILLIGLAALVIAEFLLPYRPVSDPRWFWNIDSALYYLIFFVLGYLTFPLILGAINKLDKYKVIIVVFTALAVIYSSLLFFGVHYFTRLLALTPGASQMIAVVDALVIIWVNICAAIFLERFEILQKLGKNTLWFCGNEFVVKFLFANALAIFGVNLKIANPLIVILYCVGLLFLAYYTVIPIEKAIYHRLAELIHRLFKPKKFVSND